MMLHSILYTLRGKGWVKCLRFCSNGKVEYLLFNREIPANSEVLDEFDNYSEPLTTGSYTKKGNEVSIALKFPTFTGTINGLFRDDGVFIQKRYSLDGTLKLYNWERIRGNYETFPWYSPEIPLAPTPIQVATITSIDKVPTTNGFLAKVYSYGLIILLFTGCFTCATRKRDGAKCRDGWNSSATGSGACSHHGGVRRWTYVYWWEWGD